MKFLYKKILAVSILMSLTIVESTKALRWIPILEVGIVQRSFLSSKASQ